LKDWEKTLDSIHRAGWSYGYVQFQDRETGQLFWQVDISKENVRIKGIGPTMEAAVVRIVAFLY